MGHSPNSSGAIGALRKQYQQRSLLDEEADACVREAVRLHHPMIVAESILTRAVILIVRTIQARMIIAEHGKPLALIPESLLGKCP
jgi:hypothetical protein